MTSRLFSLPTQDNTVAIVAIAVSGGVALVAAVLAPLTAHYRQRTALREESERLDRQLAHDRLLRDLAELRERVDEVVAMGEAALSAVCTARLHFNDGDHESYGEELRQASECLGQYGFKERRVMLRTGRDHPLVDALAIFRQRVQALSDLVKSHADQGGNVPPDQWNAGMAEVAAAQAKVIEAGMASIGSQIDQA
jgi:hypothetical protein